MADKIGKRYRYKDLEFHAVNGLVYIYDYRPNRVDFVVESAENFAARAISRQKEIDTIPYADERNELIRAIVDMCAVIKETKKQGRPSDSNAAKKLAYENRKLIFQANFDPKRHEAEKSKLIIAAAGDHYSYESPFPAMPQNPKGKLVDNDSAPDLSV